VGIFANDTTWENVVFGRTKVAGCRGNYQAAQSGGGGAQLQEMEEPATSPLKLGTDFAGND